MKIITKSGTTPSQKTHTGKNTRPSYRTGLTWRPQNMDGNEWLRLEMAKILHNEYRTIGTSHALSNAYDAALGRAIRDLELRG